MRATTPTCRSRLARDARTPVKLDRRFVEADLRIATGLVEPHFMAGWSGGRKVVAPGVAHHETIRTFHSARFMEDPLAVQCNRSAIRFTRSSSRSSAAGRRLRPQHCHRRRARSRLRQFRRDFASHAAAVEFVNGAIRVPPTRRFKTVVTSSAGYPLDKTYYQTIKGMVTPLDILEPGGDLIIASECSEGFGSDEFRAAQRRLIDLGPENFCDPHRQVSGGRRRMADRNATKTDAR